MNIGSEKAVPASRDSTGADLRIAKEKETRIDQWTDRFSDWFSPILVKETRQQLKSRQFFWTFFLLLAAVAVWTMIGLTFNDASTEFGNAGPALLTGYWIVLGFPLAIVIPFGAYRSLAREFEDGTIQLISVTTMKAWQIVAGKLGSSMLQMLIYLSVLAPCIAFTYLLRGLSLPQITVGMAICISGCFGLSCLALFCAGATRSKLFGVGNSILLILVQFFLYGLWTITSGSLAFGELAFLAREEGMFVTAGIIALITSTGLLAFSAATALISFDADNRSTIVRIMMLVQQTLFIGWSISLMCYFIEPEQAFIFAFVMAHYWLFMGAILIGESDELSARVRRSIPQTWLNRTLFSLLLPGSGRGLIFAITNIWICGFIFLATNLLGPDWFPEAATDTMGFGTGQNSMLTMNMHRYVSGMISGCLYSSFFLSLDYIICAWCRRQGRTVTSVFSLAVGLLLVGMTTGTSLLFHYNFLPSRQWNDYSLDLIFNWYWTSFDLIENGFAYVDFAAASLAAVIMSSVCLTAMFRAARELLQARQETPLRVEQDNQAAQRVQQLPAGELIDEIFGKLKDRG